MRIAVCGGTYSNPWAMRAFADDARRNGAERLYCLGDLGGYGAEPEAIWDLLTGNDVICIAGNYDVAIAAGAGDCGCGYRDPRDQAYAQAMYDYTLSRTSKAFAAWMGTLPTERREPIEGCDVHFVHGSTIGLNDFWWESLSEAEHQRRVLASGAELIMCTHSGLPWQRRIAGSLVVNVGVLGRPPNDGRTAVRYAIADLAGGRAETRIVSLDYDWRAQAGALRRAGLPDEFACTCETGWWTTCLEILPAAERSLGAFHVYDSSVPALLSAFGLPPDSWPDPEPAIPVRSLWGSPLLPSHIWCESGTSGLVELTSAATAAGTSVRDLTTRPAGSAGLTVTADGWEWQPLSGQSVPIPMPPGTSPARQFTAARHTAIRHLLRMLQDRGLLLRPRYCAA